MTGRPAVSVLIPTRDGRERVRRALDALAGQTLPAADFEVCVAVNGSADGTLELLEELETPFALRVVAVEPPGRAGACNAALAAAGGEVVVILDDDMRPAPELLERHRRHHQDAARRCVMGAVPVALDEHSTGAAHVVARNFREHLARLAEPGHRFTTRDFYSGNASVRADVLREVGGYDTGFAVYGNEDVELALRLRAAGVELAYDPDALAWQSYEKDLAGLAADTRAKGGTTVRLARMHPEVFGTLRLARPDDASRPWLALRAVLLALTRRRPPVAHGVTAVAARLERVGIWHRRLGYRALLDYAFWTGAQAALDPAGDGEDLAWLSRELHRGPLDLLVRGGRAR